jgi:CPA2 family monovalent cation:H+ antiporter-2
VAITLALNITAALIAARLHGYGRRPTSAIAFTILGRGEFSLVLAAFAAEADLDPRIGPFVALYVLVLAVGAPILAARSDAMAKLLPQGLFGAGTGPAERATT